METINNETCIAGISCTIIGRGRIGRTLTNRFHFSIPVDNIRAQAKVIHENMVFDGYQNVELFWQPEGYLDIKIPLSITG